MKLDEDEDPADVAFVVPAGAGGGGRGTCKWTDRI